MVWHNLLATNVHSQEHNWSKNGLLAMFTSPQWLMWNCFVRREHNLLETLLQSPWWLIYFNWCAINCGNVIFNFTILEPAGLFARWIFFMNYQQFMNCSWTWYLNNSWNVHEQFMNFLQGKEPVFVWIFFQNYSSSVCLIYISIIYPRSRWSWFSLCNYIL